MDLNQKIAARREELARIAKEKKLAEDRITKAEVTRILQEKGILLPESPGVPSDIVDAEVDKAFTKAAANRMTRGENIVIVILALLSLVGFSIAWWLGIIFGVWFGLFYSKAVAKYKKQILAEGELNRAGKQNDAG
jgi:hypothetical protein